MKNIRGYTEHLRETNSMETPKKLGQRLLRFIDKSKTPNIEEVKMLIAAGAELDARDKYVGLTPLHRAAANGHTEIAKLLIAAGAEPDARNSFGWTPLHAAASNGRTETAKLLIDAGAELDAMDNDGWTPLHAAALYGRTETVSLLIDAGADILSAFDSLEELKKFFKDDISWIRLPPKWRRAIKTKNLFGV
jgi:ankyrin repeat protein